MASIVGVTQVPPGGPGDSIYVSWQGAASADSMEVFIENQPGEELAFSNTQLSLPTSEDIPGIQDGYIGTVINPAGVLLTVRLWRPGGWDPPSGVLNIRTEIVDDGTPETWTDSVNISPVLSTVHNPDHEATALSRLLSQFDGSPQFRDLVSSYLSQVQNFEDVAYQIINARNIDVAVGYQLDGLGQIVNVLRGGRTDEDYRLRIRAELAILLSQGTVEDLIHVMQLLLGLSSPPDIQIDEYYPKAIFMRPRNFDLQDDPVTVAALLRRAAPAATNLQFVYSQTESDDDDLFRFSDTNGTSETSSSHGYSNGTFTGAK